MLNYEIYPKAELIVITFVGPGGFAELMDLIQTYMKDPSYQPHFKGVVDFRRGTLQATPAQIEAIAAFVVQNHFALGPWCHIVTDPRSTALGSLYAMQIEGEHAIEVFSTVAGASSFLGLDLTQFIPADE